MCSSCNFGWGCCIVLSNMLILIVGESWKLFCMRVYRFSFVYILEINFIILMLFYILQAWHYTISLSLLHLSFTKNLIFIRCLHPENMFFPPFDNSTDYCSETAILYNHPEIEKRASACCDDSDFCNERLDLKLPPG